MDTADNKPETGTPAPDNAASREPAVSSSGVNDATDAYNYYDEFGYEQAPPEPEAPATALATPAEQPGSPAPPPAPPPAFPTGDDEEEGGDEEDGMLRMSFLEHLEELRSRLIQVLLGFGVAFAACIAFSPAIWDAIQAPARAALLQIGANPNLVMNKPTEAFSIIWVKVPVLVSIFLASPWVLYQVWGFVSPGLYKRERRYAAPFILCSAGLFVAGGLFAYFVAFPLGLAFLLGIGSTQGVTPLVSITEYFDLFVNVTLGMGAVFELPILIFFLSLLRIVTPQFLINNSRYAILAIIIIAAIITPTPDVVNLMLIAVPMTLLYFAGVFASYLLWLSRQNRRFPWGIVALVLGLFVVLFALSTYAAVTRYGFEWRTEWPYLVNPGVTAPAETAPPVPHDGPPPVIDSTPFA